MNRLPQKEEFFSTPSQGFEFNFILYQEKQTKKPTNNNNNSKPTKEKTLYKTKHERNAKIAQNYKKPMELIHTQMSNWATTGVAYHRRHLPI